MHADHDADVIKNHKGVAALVPYALCYGESAAQRSIALPQSTALRCCNYCGVMHGSCLLQRANNAVQFLLAAHMQSTNMVSIHKKMDLKGPKTGVLPRLWCAATAVVCCHRCDVLHSGGSTLPLASWQQRCPVPAGLPHAERKHDKHKGQQFAQKR